MSKNIKLTPAELKNQAAEMKSLTYAYKDLFDNIISRMHDINDDWSENLSNNFTSKIAAAQNSFSTALAALEYAATEAENIADDFDDTDNWLANLIEKFLRDIGILHEESSDNNSGAVSTENIVEKAPEIEPEPEPVKPLPEKLPDWARQGVRMDDYKLYFTCSDGSPWSVFVWNQIGAQVSCTYYTLKRLYDKGLGFPFETASKGAGASQWFDNCTGVTKLGGNESIESLYNQYGDLENVVVTFNQPEHVLLVDRVFKDENSGQIMLEYSDMFMNYVSHNDPYSNNSIATITLEAFKQHYNKYNGPIQGAIIIGN